MRIHDHSKVEFLVKDPLVYDEYYSHMGGELSDPTKYGENGYYISVGELSNLMQNIPSVWACDPPLSTTFLALIDVYHNLTDDEVVIIVNEGMEIAVGLLKLKCWQFLHIIGGDGLIDIRFDNATFTAIAKLTNRLLKKLPQCELSCKIRAALQDHGQKD